MTTTPPSRERALAALDAAFAEVPRPEVFGRGTCGCSECVDHEATLASHTRETIGIAELGNPGWDPICFASDAAFTYYLPTLARLALDPETFYASQLSFHIGCRGRVDALSRTQAAALLDVICAGLDAWADEDPCLDLHGMDEAVRLLEARITAAGGERA